MFKTVNEYFYYVIVSDTPAGYPRGATVIKSNLNWLDFKDYIDSRTEKIHESGKDRIYRNGAVQYINPKIMGIDDFKNYIPEIVEFENYEKVKKQR